MDLANFTPFPDEWTDEDKVLFEQAFHFHGKSFHRIRQMVSSTKSINRQIHGLTRFILSRQLPDKNIASLVKYYYSWKKTRSRTSVMDRQEKNKIKEGSENGSENGSNEESDTEEKVGPRSILFSVRSFVNLCCDCLIGHAFILEKNECETTLCVNRFILCFFDLNEKRSFLVYKFSLISDRVNECAWKCVSDENNVPSMQRKILLILLFHLIECAPVWRSWSKP